ncbi:MAG: 16S rRNA processing protein RimM [Magnetococcales bacterium]|nr:16S rRNA processing protein RimM [Magnetococcales bacterium]
MTDQYVRWLTLGRLIGAFGVHGEVRVQTFTEDPERLLGFPEWYLEFPEKGSRRKVAVVSGRRHGEGAVVVRLAGVATREEAQLLAKARVLVERTQMPEPEEGQFYWADLEGCRVVTGDGLHLGTVQSMMATGANDVMVMTTPDGTERLLPFNREVVETVDLPQRMITVQLMPGL